MKKFFLTVLLIGAAFALAACAGGSGSGGGAGGASSVGITSATADNIFPGATRTGNASMATSPLQGAAPLVITAESDDKNLRGDIGSFKMYEASNSGAILVNFSDGTDLKEYDNGFVVASGPTPAPGTPEMAGVVAALQAAGEKVIGPGSHTDAPLPNGSHDIDTFTGTIAYGNQTVAFYNKLDHSTFGFWAVDIEQRGSMYEENVSGGKPDTHAATSKASDYVAYLPFYGGIEANEVAPQAAAAFTGPATAMKVEHQKDRGPTNEYLNGTVALNVTSAGSGDIALAFNNLGTFNVNGLAISGAGNINQSSPNFTFTPSAGNPDWSNKDYAGSYVKAQFYGSGGTAEEMAGKFRFSGTKATDQQGIEVLGAFGGKKQ
jgi:hypothetical protein